MKISTDILIKQLESIPMAEEVFEKYIPGRLTFMKNNPQAKHLSLKQTAVYSRGSIPMETVQLIVDELKGIHGDYIITDVEKEKIAAYQELEKRIKEVYGAPEVRNAVYPGRPITDTEGKRIQAHGGAVFFDEGYYYWYGENKEYTKGTDDMWTWGVKAYRSSDFYNWEDLGQIINPVLDDPDSMLFPETRVDRPHILHNTKTGKYVCWIHLAGKIAGFMILQADEFTGPYEIVNDRYQPYGYAAGDFDLAQDEDGKAYLYYDVNHSTVVAMVLSDDYLTVEKEVSRQYENMTPPFCREGVAVFERRGKCYMISSGMTGYVPNRSDLAVADSLEGPFESIGNPYPDDETNSSYNSQVTDVFKVPGKQDLYILMSDRWVPEYPVDAKLADIIERAVASKYDPQKYQTTEEEQKVFEASPNLHTANTSIADYVWLPITFNDGKPEIKWLDSWSLDDYE